MKRKFLILLLCLTMVLSFTLTGCSNEKATKDVSSNNNVSSNNEDVQETSEELSEDELWKLEPAYGQVIKIGYNGGLCLGAFGIAHIKGFYEELGLKTEIVKMTTQVDALGTGQVDVAGDHIATLMVPTVNGVNMIFTRGAHSGCKSLYVLADSGIEKTSDLIGKAVAIHDGIGASDHNIALRFFKADGVDINQIKFKNIETSASILAMQNDEVQAAIFSDQYAQKFVADGTLKAIRSLTTDEDFMVEPCCVHAVNRDFYEKNPITVKKLTQAHKNASDWIEENKEEAAKILLENNWASGEYEDVLAFMKTLNFKISDEATASTLEKIINDYKEFGLIDKNLDTQETLNYIWAPVLSK